MNIRKCFLEPFFRLSDSVIYNAFLSDSVDFICVEGVIVGLDDSRTLGVLAAMKTEAQKDLLEINGRKGGIWMLWKPGCLIRHKQYAEGGSIQVPDGDIWSIMSSKEHKRHERIYLIS